MKKLVYLLFVSITFLFLSCSQKDILIDDFESGTYEKWTVKGNAFGDAPIQRSDEMLQHNNKLGKYYADSFGGNDSLFGTLTSEEFIIDLCRG